MKISASNQVIGLQELSYGLDALTTMYEATGDSRYIQDAIEIVKNVIQRSKVSKDIGHSISPFKDGFRGWTEQSKGSNSGYKNKEIPLSEIYFFRYVGKLLRVVENNTELKSKYRRFFSESLSFLENDIWNKWRTRGYRLKGNYNQYIFLQRTHMTCHWAFIAADLYFLTNDSFQKNQYLDFVNLYNKRLFDNIKYNDGYVIWNATWDFYQEQPRIQDVSHANLIVAYLLEVRDLGIISDDKLINALVYTVKNKLWDPTRNTFKDYLDGTYAPGRSNTGSFQADGFVKLARFDDQLLAIYNKFASESPLVTKWRQHGQLFANLALVHSLVK